MHINRYQQRFVIGLLALAILPATTVEVATAQQTDLPDQAKPWRQLDSEGVTAHVHQKTVWLRLDASAVKKQKVVIPRICSPIRSIRWKGQPEAEIKFWPEPQEWVFSWKAAPAETPVIEVVFDRKPVLPPECRKASPSGDGSVMLHAYQASTFGEKLRFEPQWYKNTVGYWTIPTDYATWKLAIDQVGTFSVAALQGCGAGQGGSDAAITLRQGEQLKAELPFQSVDTGHFQNFRWVHLGMIDIDEAGEYELRIAPRRIAKGALFDVRTIHLVRQAKSPE